jgi:hypothetical protein
MFLHLTYSYVDNPSSVFDQLKPMAEKAAPPAFAYRSSKDIPLTDSGPTGFIAEYQGAARARKGRVPRFGHAPARTGGGGPDRWK